MLLSETCPVFNAHLTNSLNAVAAAISASLVSDFFVFFVEVLLVFIERVWGINLSVKLSLKCPNGVPS